MSSKKLKEWKKPQLFDLSVDRTKAHWEGPNSDGVILEIVGEGKVELGECPCS